VAYSKFDISTGHAQRKNWTLSNLKARGRAYLLVYSSLARPGKKTGDVQRIMVSN
jgi:hypothetical protein